MAAYCEIGVDLNLRDYGAVTRAAVNELSQSLEARSRTEISAGVGRRQAKTSYSRIRGIGKGGYEVNFFARPGWVVGYEYGAVSVGRPLLWMPAPGSPYRGRARDYPGKLYRPKGRRVLINPVTRKVAYIGIPQVTTTARLHLRDIAEDEAVRFVDRMKADA